MVKPLLVLGLFVSVICFEESSEKSMPSGFSGQGPLPVFDRAPSSPGVVNLYTSHIYILGFSFYSLRGIYQKSTYCSLVFLARGFLPVFE